MYHAPTQPYVVVVLPELLAIVVTDSEAVGQPEQLALILGEGIGLDRGSERLEYVGQVADRATAVR